MIQKEEIVFLARDLLTELPESAIFSRENLIGLIPSAITLWQARTNDDPDKRHAFIQESDQITIKNNSADIADAVEEFGFRLDFLKDSDIAISYTTGNNFKVKFQNSPDRLALTGRQDKFFIKAYLSGTRITFKFPPAGTGDAAPPTPSKFKIRSVVIPDDLSDVPSSCAPDIAMVVAELAKGQFLKQNKGLDIPVK